MDLGDLLIRYRANKCTEEEVRWLIRHIRSGRDRERIENFLGETLEDAFPEMHEEDEQVFRDAFARILEKRGAPRQRVIPIRWLRYVAVLLVVSGLGGLVYVRQQHRADPATAPAPLHTITAGENRSTLTLENGRVVELDDVADGDSIVAGNVTILKSDGMLTYRAHAEAADKTERHHTVAVSQGTVYKVVLSDGTLIELNAGSSIRYPAVFTSAERQVELLGEGYFEVAKKAYQPFRVKTKDLNIAVLGTIFNVKAYDNERFPTTTLIEGKVKLHSPKDSLVLTPGHEAALAADGRLTTARVDVQSAVKWRRGVFQFSGNSLDVILSEIARWYGLRLVYRGNKVPAISIGGEMVRPAAPRDVVEVLKASGLDIELKEHTLFINP